LSSAASAPARVPWPCGGVLARLVALIAWALAATGCGYSSGVRLPAGAETVGVTVFENSTPQPELERDLFARLSLQASRMIDAEIVAPDRADIVVRGVIVEYRRLQGVLSIEGQLQQTGVRIILRAWLEDQRIGARIGQPIQVDQALRYVVRAGEEEQGARRVVIEHLCQELILDLFNQVDYGTGPPPDPTLPEEEELDALQPQPLGTGREDPLGDA